MVFETSAGLIHVEVSWLGDQIKISMTQPAPRFGLKIDKKIKDLKFKDYYENYNKYLRVIYINEFKKMF